MKEITIFALVVVLAVWGIGTWAFNAHQSYCYSWGQGTGRETRFIGEMWKYSDCLVKTDSGWISGTKLEQVETPSFEKLPH